MSTLNIQLLCRRSIDFPELATFASRPGTMINLHWLELPMARTIFHGPKDVRAIDVRLYAGRYIYAWFDPYYSIGEQRMLCPHTFMLSFVITLLFCIPYVICYLVSSSYSYFFPYRFNKQRLMHPGFKRQATSLERFANPINKRERLYSLLIRFECLKGFSPVFLS